MEKIQIKTHGHGDCHDLTTQIEELVGKSQVQNGIVNLFLSGSTAAITTIEFEKGAIRDFVEVLEKIAPENHDYHHHLAWGDRNGAAHFKAALIGPNLTIPLDSGKLQLGDWQQIVLFDFDEKPRTREILVQIIKS